MKRADVLTAIKGSGAVMSTIAKRLGVDWHTAKKWCMNWEETRQSLDDEDEAILDLAESKLFQAIDAGDVQAAKWILSTRGKRRGYSEKQEVELTGRDGGPVMFVAPTRFKSAKEWEEHVGR